MLRTVAQDKLHAVAANRVQVGAAHDERDVVAGQCELDADVAADGARTDDRDFHRTLLSPRIARVAPTSRRTPHGLHASDAKLRFVEHKR